MKNLPVDLLNAVKSIFSCNMKLRFIHLRCFQGNFIAPQGPLFLQKVAKRPFSVSSESRRFSLTTPIFYCNASPHIGHLYTVVLADAFNRFHELLGEKKCTFATGTDEHGIKIFRAAASNNMSPLAFCDKVSKDYQDLFDQSEVKYTHFMRTTDSRHINAVKNFWKRLSDEGHVYTGKYSGWYCVADEAFLPETQIKSLAHPTSKNEFIKVSTESGHPVEWAEEENYMFRLSSFKDDLLHWLSKEKVIIPENFHRLVLKSITEMELEDISISRPASRVPWGISVPQNGNQTIYVWLDALVSYLTAAGYPDDRYFEDNWPPTIQILGKDILRFHAVYWPAFLMAARLEPPNQLFVHSHWTVDSEKMSKSRGNVVSPPSPSHGGTLHELISMRYFLLRTGTPHKDNNFSLNLMNDEVNADLVSSLGNLLSRCTGHILNPMQRYPPLPGELPDCSECSSLMASVENLADTVEPHYHNGNFYLGIISIMKTVFLANEFITAMAPWKFSKEEKEKGKHLPTLHVIMEALRVCGIALQPIVPSVASTLLSRLGVPNNERMWCHMHSVSWKGGSSAKGYQLHLGYIKLFERIGKLSQTESTSLNMKQTK